MNEKTGAFDEEFDDWWWNHNGFNDPMHKEEFYKAWCAARALERERCASIVKWTYGWVDGIYYDDLADAIHGLPSDIEHIE